MPFAQSSELPPPSATIESTQRRRERATGLDHRSVGVFAEIVKGEDFDAGCDEQLPRLVDVAARDHPLIGDEQRAIESEIARQFAKSFERA